MKINILLLVLFLISSPVLSQQSIWFHGTFEEAKDKAQKENKQILIDFYADD